MLVSRMYRTQIHSAHYIIGHEKCGEVHGHTYYIEVGVEAREPFLDFHIIKEKVESVVKPLDHCNITDKFHLSTAEDIAETIARMVSMILNRCVEVTVWETDKFGAMARVCPELKKESKHAQTKDTTKKNGDYCCETRCKCSSLSETDISKILDMIDNL